MVNSLQSLVAVLSTLSLSGCLCMVPMATMQGERHEGMGKTTQGSEFRGGSTPVEGR